MDAIFETSMNDMQRAINAFGSYMEKASLQFNIELEEYVESVLNYNSSSSIVALEASRDNLIEKTKNAIRTLIERVKTFWANTKKNIVKYTIDKKIEDKIKRIEEKCDKYPTLKKLKINHKDFSAKKKFIKREKEELKKLFGKKTKAEEIRNQMKKVKEKLKDSEMVKKVAVPIFVFGSIKFYKKMKDDFDESCKLSGAEMADKIKEIEVCEKKLQAATKKNWEDEAKKAQTGAKMENVKEEIHDDMEMAKEYQEALNAYMQLWAYLSSEEARVLEEELRSYANTIGEIEQNRMLQDVWLQQQQIDEMNNQMLQQQINNSMFFM